jgi:hypothetical protein
MHAGAAGKLTERPLWTCPKCKHRFISANLWHSCTRYTLDERFANSTPEARAAFNRFVELVVRCGPVTVIAQKTRIVLMVRVRFAGAVVQRDRVRLNFSLTRQLDAPWVERIEVYMGGRWNAHRFVARDRPTSTPSRACRRCYASRTAT